MGAEVLEGQGAPGAPMLSRVLPDAPLPPSPLSSCRGAVLPLLSLSCPGEKSRGMIDG